MRYAREIECGTFLVNSFEEGDMTQPFGAKQLLRKFRLNEFGFRIEQQA